jgi:outer membrane protein
MRRTPFAALALAFALAAGSAGAQTLKIGYINSQEILAQAPGAKEAQAQFDKDMQNYNAEAQQLRDELSKMQEDFQNQELTLSKEAKANRQQAIQQKSQQVQQRLQELDQQAQQRRQELVQPVMDKINAVIDTIRTQGKYTFILDAAAGSILSADPSLDLTQEVIRRLKAQSDTAKVPAKAPAKAKGGGGGGARR